MPKRTAARGRTDPVAALASGTSEEKIAILEALSDSDELRHVEAVISMLDDPDIRVRGEAFSSLVGNNGKISKILIHHMNSPSKFVRGFATLVLANRNDRDGIPGITGLTEDPSSMVRSCAVGSLGFLGAQSASKAIHHCLTDPSIEVKKSALQAIIKIGERLRPEEVAKIGNSDDELEKLLMMAQRGGGPGGI